MNQVIDSKALLTDDLLDEIAFLQKDNNESLDEFIQYCESSSNLMFNMVDQNTQGLDSKEIFNRLKLNNRLWQLLVKLKAPAINNQN